jgi:cytochrome b561
MSNMLKVRRNQYGTVVISIHWLSAILILGLLCSGFGAANTLDTTSKTSI